MTNTWHFVLESHKHNARYQRNIDGRSPASISKCFVFSYLKCFATFELGEKKKQPNAQMANKLKKFMFLHGLLLHFEIYHNFQIIDISVTIPQHIFTHFYHLLNYVYRAFSIHIYGYIYRYISL